jgi:hypothetical protein
MASDHLDPRARRCTPVEHAGTFGALARCLPYLSPCTNSARTLRCRIVPYLDQGGALRAPRVGACAGPLPWEARPGARRPNAPAAADHRDSPGAQHVAGRSVFLGDHCPAPGCRVWVALRAALRDRLRRTQTCVHSPGWGDQGRKAKRSGSPKRPAAASAGRWRRCAFRCALRAGPGGFLATGRLCTGRRRHRRCGCRWSIRQRSGRWRA